MPLAELNLQMLDNRKKEEFMGMEWCWNNVHSGYYWQFFIILSNLFVRFGSTVYISKLPFFDCFLSVFEHQEYKYFLLH